jgi:phosphate transport system substrate-binding protein
MQLKHSFGLMRRHFLNRSGTALIGVATAFSLFACSSSDQGTSKQQAV